MTRLWGVRRCSGLGLALVLAGCAGAPVPTPRATSPSASSGNPAPSVTVPAARLTPSPTSTVPASPTAALTDLGLALKLVVGGLAEPVYVTDSGDGSGRLFVVERAGRIRIVEPDGRLAAAPFLDIRSSIRSSYIEQGLLGLAFSTTYARDGRFYVDYTDRAGNTVIAAYQRLDAGHADPSSARVLLRIEQPYQNHNGGQLAFGPDGFLYVGMGDGGGAGDPQNNGQRLNTLLGKILRIDVNRGVPYAIPASNPFATRSGARPEIWDYGLRNPWRFSFDRQTGALFIGDVGQSVWEEIDALPAGRGGLDLGWRIMEGGACYAAATCDRQGLTLPVATYDHSRGDCAVVGGFVYRGTAYPALDGVYLFGDDCSGRIRAFRAAGAAGSPVTTAVVLETHLAISSFGQDDAGELYVCDLAGGAIYRLTARGG